MHGCLHLYMLLGAPGLVYIHSWVLTSVCMLLGAPEAVYIRSWVFTSVYMLLGAPWAVYIRSWILTSIHAHRCTWDARGLKCYSTAVNHNNDYNENSTWNWTTGLNSTPGRHKYIHRFIHIFMQIDDFRYTYISTTLHISIYPYPHTLTHPYLHAQRQ